MVKPRLKDFLPNIFGNSSKKDSTNTVNTTSNTSATTTTSTATPTSNHITTTTGRLETDALPVDDTIENNNGNRMQSMSSVASTPTASADLTESVVRELSNPNYNSMEVAQLSNEQQQNMAMSPMTTDNALTAINDGNGNSNTTTTMNTMNVHNAQQQLVMQFSNVNKLHIGSVFNFNNNLSASASSTNVNCAEEGASCGGAGSGTGSGVVGGAGVGNVTAGGSMSKRQTPRKTVSIVGMMQSQEEPNTRMLDTISTHLGEGWKDVMRKLGHSDGQIEQAIIDHQMHGGIKEVIYQLLLEWVRNADDGVGTLGNITTLLWECNQRDCVQRMKLVWKAEVKRKISS